MIPDSRYFSRWSAAQTVPRARGAILLLLAAFCAAAGVGPVIRAVEPAVSVVPWSTPERVGTGFQFTEGPVWHPEGFLLFSDVQGNRIVKWTAPGESTTFRQPSGNSNGLAFDTQGRLIACEHLNRRISRTESGGEVATLADKYEGQRLNSPNDLAIKSDGSIYFTDPPYGISSGQQELPFNGVFRISPKGELTLLASDFDRPNGLAFSPDESKLYIADTTRGHIRVFDVQPDGTLGVGQEFVQVANGDGMKVDSKGRVYVASRDGVAVFNARGETIGTIALPEQPANCCFGDADKKTLFVTARTSIYAVRLNDSEVAADSKQTLRLTWWSLPERTYAIYRSDDMVTWDLSADGVLSKGGSSTTWSDPSAPLLSPEVRRRYYKVTENE